MTTSPTAAAVFAVDERVWVASKRKDDSYSEGVIRQCRPVQQQSHQNNNYNTPSLEYLIHYIGWNARYDEWLPHTRLRKEKPKPLNPKTSLAASSAATTAVTDATTQQTDNSTTTPSKEASLVQQQQQSSADGSAKKTKKRKLAPPNSNNENAPTNSNASSTVDYSPLPPSKAKNTAPRSRVEALQDACELPWTLQTVLVDEWERIMVNHTIANSGSSNNNASNRRLVHVLPAPVTVQQIVRHYCRQQMQQQQHPGNAGKTLQADLHAFRKQLLQLFDQALMKILLYPNERAQFEHYYAQAQSNANDTNTTAAAESTTSSTTIQWASVCGCEYLLRLYLRLPMLLQQAVLLEEEEQRGQKNSNGTAAAPGDNDNSSRCSTSSTANASAYTLATHLGQLLELLQERRAACFPTGPTNYRPVQPHECGEE